MIFGIITTVMFILVVLSGYPKKPKIVKLHKIFGYLLAIFSIIHLCLALRLWNNRPTSMNTIGIVMTVIIIVVVLLEVLKKRNKLTHYILTGVILILLLVHIFLGFSSLSNYKKKVSELTINEIDITQVKDGAYEGECDVIYIYAKVIVSVKDGKINEIEIIEHRNEKGSKAEAIINDIENKQDNSVDVISSATNSSLVIQKAIENALKKGVIE